MSTWLIRRTLVTDEDFLWEMLFYASHSNDEPGASPQTIRDNPDLVDYVDGWKRGGLIGVIAEEARLPVGAAWLRQLGEEDRSNPVYVDPETPELAMAVVPGTEGRGMGAAMFAALLLQARGRFPAITLSSRLENPAVRLYERLGFRTVGEMTNRVGTRSVKMIIDLESPG